MNRAPRWSLIIFAAGALAVLGGLAWVTVHALRLDRREQAARAEAALQESIRLSLWRMDSLLTPIIAREAARPAAEYQAFFPIDRAYTQLWQEVHGLVLPSPLLPGGERFVRLHFQVDPDGVLSSPQAPTGNMRDQAESAYVLSDWVIENEDRLGQLETILRGRDLLGHPLRGGATGGGVAGGDRPAPAGAARPGQAAGRSYRNIEGVSPAPAQSQTEAVPEQQVASAPPSQIAQSVQEYAARQQAAESARNRADPQDRAVTKGGAGRPLTPPPPAPTTAVAPDRFARTPADSDPAKPAAEPQPSAVTGISADQAKSAADRKAEAAREAEKSPAAPLPPPPAADAPGAVLKEAAPSLPPPTAAPTEKLAELGAATRATSDYPPRPEPGELTPVWITNPSTREPELLLVRPVRTGKSEVVQGVWLDWPALRAWLLEQVADRLPAADLVPVLDDAGATIATSGHVFDPRLTRRLAAVPAELIPDADAVLAHLGLSTASGGWTPMRTALLLAWIMALGAVGAIAVVLRTSIDLAERRGRFVSAVTHELRTPLTTFCLYSQMLADGMVPREETRREYLGTLKREAQRLAGIVENVLEYARLGRRRPRHHRDHLTAEDLLDRIVPRLRERAGQAGMTLIDESGGLDGRVLDTDAQTVERILLNLVDNACKYAADAPDGRIYLAANIRAATLELEVADHGPGVKPEDEARIFEPFYRGEAATETTNPGLGLGLALARGLAQQLGGDLRLVRHSGPGATFVLALPIGR